MQAAFDQTLPQPSRWDQDGAEYVVQHRLVRPLLEAAVAMNPGLTAEQALDLAHELSLDDRLRAKAPELVAEEMHQVDVLT